MHDELTKVDIKKMQEEIEYRRNVLAPTLREEVRQARELGDLSENFEYHAARREMNKNIGRINYLQRMIDTAVVIEPKSEENSVGLFDTVTLYVEDVDEEMTITIVTTLRQNSLKNLISKESPIGKALLGKKSGERIFVRVSDDYGYYAVIRGIEKGSDDESLEISPYYDKEPPVGRLFFI